MKWVRYRIRTTPEAEDILISELCALGFEGAQIEDNVPLTAAEKEQIYTYDADDPVDDGIACVSFYTALNEDGTVTPAEGFEDYPTPDALRERVEKALADLRTRMDIGDGTLDVSVMDDAEWKDNWKQFFHSFCVDDVFITPSWEEDTNVPDNARYVLRIDPGTAFGTGAHETTQIAIRLIRQTLDKLQTAPDMPDAGVRMLDIGTGSGILGILALMFGAAHVTGVDVDTFTEEAVRQNLAQNGIAEGRFQLLIGNLLEDEAFCERVRECTGSETTSGATGAISGGGYEIAVANILPVVLKPLTPLVPRVLRGGGVYIVSGILSEKETEMKAVLEENGFTVTETIHQGEWCGMAAQAGRPESVRLPQPEKG